jgi:hypothetical protein
MLAKRAFSYIYSLSDPISGSVRYIGQSVKPKERLSEHIRQARTVARYRCHRWIATILASDKRPIMEILEEVPIDDVNEAECRWIDHFRALGADLTNHTNGGGGLRGYKLSVEHIAKLVASNKGKKRSEEIRSRLREIQNSPEMKAHLSEKRKWNKSRTGQTQSDEEKLKRAAANRGKKRSPEFCLAASERMMGVRHSEETKKKMGESKRAMISPERRSEIARIGNLASQEAKKCR